MGTLLKLVTIVLCVLGLAACAATVPPQTGAATDVAADKAERLLLETTPQKLFGSNIPDYVASALKPDEKISYDIRLPVGYDPARPSRLLVFISARPRARLPGEWQQVLDDHNVIFIAARKSGNTVTNGRRISYALMARALAAENWNIDADRSWLSGFSGGGRVASLTMPQFPKAYSGAIYFSGVNYVGDAPQLYQELQGKRFVFIAGEFDFNRAGTEEIHSKYQAAGISNAELIIVPDMEHVLPPGDTLAKAMEFLSKE